MLGIIAAALLAGAQPAPPDPPAAVPQDPLGSPVWEEIAAAYLDGGPVRFDPRVRVRMPDITENQRVFPVEIDARGIAGVRRMLVLIDLNPIQKAVDYRLGAAEPFLAVRVKLDQRTPVRGAVQLADGSWLVGGGWVDAAGGGCSLPPVSRAKGDWAAHLGEVRGAAWPRGAAAVLRLAMRHPMDTGFVANIGAYYLEELALTDGTGRDLGHLDLLAAVAEDPALTLMPRVAAGDRIRIDGHDTSGIAYRGVVPVPAMSSIPAP